MVPREDKIQEGSPDSIVLRFHQYIDKHSLSPLGAFREAPGENKQRAFAVPRSYLFGAPIRCARVREALSCPCDRSGRGIVSLRCREKSARACVCGHNRLFRVDLCGALRQNVRCDPA